MVAAETIEGHAGKAVALGDISQVLAELDQHEEAQQTLVAAFNNARQTSRSQVFEVLEKGASTLSTRSQHETLWNLYQAVQEVDGWWEFK